MEQPKPDDEIDEKKSSFRSLFKTLLLIIIAIGMTVLFQAFIVKPYKIPSESMEPTLDVGQHILVSKFAYHLAEPKANDVVVFNPTVGADLQKCGKDSNETKEQICTESIPGKGKQPYIKRIVASGGDRVSFLYGHPVINGKIKLNEPYTIPCIPLSLTGYFEIALKVHKKLEGESYSKEEARAAAQSFLKKTEATYLDDFEDPRGLSNKELKLFARKHHLKLISAVAAQLHISGVAVLNSDNKKMYEIGRQLVARSQELKKILKDEPKLLLSSTELCNLKKEITVPENSFIVLGDNRYPQMSSDSRTWGPVKRDQLIGKAFFTYYPADKVGGL